MPRPALSPSERENGRALGAALKALRGTTTAAQIARAADVPLDTLRKLEQGGIPTPGFFLIVRLAAALGTTPNDLAEQTLLQRKKTP
ncbi:helix-turn-helix transcriptional regulator [Cellulomonas cellasea]|uniref:Transcriptional regulator with XRE-family HTH domain n=1 Tax=Cellulomonas cellasea TaxID=43670 RepID=A0A7W4YBP1_9CELL|nr:helix-turn-helix transcriptional regulator [Cellulomonas cellasea]MBB2924115.1 transcriptional regulator with XRE-family HTH domain [Cellulomonas cellasea]